MMHGCSERRMIPQNASNKNCDKTFAPLRHVRQTTRRGRVGNGATAVRQGYLPWDALDLAEERPFRGEEERLLMLPLPCPALVPGLLLLRPDHGRSSSGSPPSGLRGTAADWRRGSLRPAPPPATRHRR